MKIFYIYIIVINLVAAVICAVDKHQARIGGRRISEKTLITLSLLGGAVGMYLTMLKIRHKTRHKRFTVGLPIIIVIHILVIIYYLY